MMELIYKGENDIVTILFSAEHVFFSSFPGSW